MNTATPQDTFDHILGTGAFTYDWWLTADIADADTPDWAATVTGGEPGATKTATITHEVVLKTARAILGKRPQYASDALARECRNLIWAADETDFDAASSDELLQVAVFGQIIYG
jgi:hypothetical protein